MTLVGKALNKSVQLWRLPKILQEASFALTIMGEGFRIIPEFRKLLKYVYTS